MKCVLCEATNIDKSHYAQVHHVDENNVFFKKFIDQKQKVVLHRRNCHLCNEFVFCNKAQHDFVRHYGAGKVVAAAINRPLNVVTLGDVKKIEITFKEHSFDYNFYDSAALVDTFLAQVKNLVPRNEYNNLLIRAGFSIENIQEALGDYSDPLVQTRYWTTETFESKSFNDFISFKIRESVLKRVINNNLSGSAWHFNRFNYMNVKVINQPLQLLK